MYILCNYNHTSFIIIFEFNDYTLCIYCYIYQILTYNVDKRNNYNELNQNKKN